MPIGDTKKNFRSLPPYKCETKALRRDAAALTTPNYCTLNFIMMTSCSATRLVLFGAHVVRIEGSQIIVKVDIQLNN